MKRRTSRAHFVQKFRNVYIVLSKNIITIHTEPILGYLLKRDGMGGGGVLLLLASTGRLHSKGVPFLGFRYMKG